MSVATIPRPRPRARRGKQQLAIAPARYLNRELSWLDLNERVLNIAEDQSRPLLERAKFVAIFATNLDEFVQVRVAGLKRQLSAGLALTRSIDGLTAAEQLALVQERMAELSIRHAALFADDIRPALGAAGVNIVRWADLDSAQQARAQDLFMERIFPVLTPLAVDPGHPFPHISNLSLNLAVIVEDPKTGREQFARVKVPPLLERFVSPADGVHVPLEDVIAGSLQALFPGMRIAEEHAFRVTRDAELEFDDDDAEDLLEALEDELRRQRTSRTVRLEVEDSMPDHVLALLTRELEVGGMDIQRLPGPLGLAGVMDLYAIDRPDLKDPPFQPFTHPDVVTPDEPLPDMFAAVRRGDVLVHHPYDSFATSVQRFIEQAAADPDVQAIKQTLYRTSGDSPIVQALAEAAGSGKQVVVLVEIKARFDERNNIGWARLLEQAGCHVVYGVVGLKTHAKLCLVVRSEQGRLRRYVHVGTGNYNPITARIYEDLGILSASPQLGNDVAKLFNLLTGYARETEYDELIVAPNRMRDEIVQRIRRETELSSKSHPGRIMFKVNNLIDEAIIDALYDASAAGVQVDLIIRAICALRPGEPGMSENIRVKSILGRFLEHSRILWFGNGGQPEVFIGSADLMHRNLDRRVETLMRVDSGRLRRYLERTLRLAMRDNVGSWELHADGSWERVPTDPSDPVDLQGTLMQRGGRMKPRRKARSARA